MRNERIRVIAEVGLAVALAVVLNFLAARLPINIAGGSISLTMLPIFIVALRRGAIAGMVAGALFGTIDLILEPWIVHWAQVVLDYPAPYLLAGLAGLGSTAYRKAVATGKVENASLTAVFWMLVGSVFRFVAHYLSGVIFFADMAPEGMNPYWYSFLYNISYLAPSALASIVVAVIVLRALDKAVPTPALPKSA